MSITYNIPYWWGTYTKKMENDGWIYNGSNVPYKIKLQPNEGKNGKWWVIQFYNNMAWYSYCDRCNYIHAVSKEGTDSISSPDKYDKSREFNFCPRCGKRMIKTKKTIRRGY